MNQFFIQGCQAGVATSPGGGNCTPGQNACEGTKSGAQINFICPRVMLFSDGMAQAAADDGNGGMNYGVVGHDADTGGIDSTSNSCCQCYQLVFSLPENVAQVGGNGAAATLFWQVDEDKVAVVTTLLLWQPANCVAAFTPPDPGSPSGGNAV